MSSNNFDAPVFDPNAGREEAYEARKKVFFEKLLNDDNVNKINKKKAGKYFDSQFELDWNNEEMDRRIAFSRKSFDDFRKLRMAEFNNISAQADADIADLEALNAEKEYMDKGYTYTKDGWTLTNAPTLPTLPALPVRDKNGRTREEILALQQEMVDAGYDLGKFGPKGNGVDGIWGSNTQAAYDMYILLGKKPYKEAFSEIPGTNNGTYYTDNAGNRYSYTNNVLKKLSELDTKGWTNGGFIKDMDDFRKAINFWSNNVSFGGMNWSNPYYLNNVFRYTNNDPDWSGSGMGALASVRIKGKDGVYPLRVWNDRSFAIDVVNKKAYELKEDWFGEVDGEGNDSPINIYDLYSFFDNYTPEDLERLKSLRLGGTLNLRFKIGGIIKLILKNSNVFPYNLL